MLPPPLVVAAHRQGGVFTTGQALDAGLTSHELTRLVARGHCVRLRRGAYAPASTHEQQDAAGRHLLRARAVSLAAPSPHVLSHVTAAIAHGLPVHALDLEHVHLTHPLSNRATRHEARVWHHCGRLDPDEVQTGAGLAVTGLVRTALDVARLGPVPGALAVADGVLRAGVTPAMLRSALEGCSDWPGARTAGRVVSLADGGAESVGESLARLAFHDAGHPPDVTQLCITTDIGAVRCDFGWRQQRLVGEFDGRVKYGRLLRPGELTSDVLIRERQRELAIERAGWSVVRFTWGEIHQLPLVRARLRQALDRAAQRRLA